MAYETDQRLIDLAGRLQRAGDAAARTPLVIGFDAFVDESIRIVRERLTPESHVGMKTIADFGAWATAAAGKSGSREFVCEETRAGGCSVNLGDGLTTLGFPLTAFSGVGEPSHPVFDAYVRACESVRPLGMEPGRAIVAEFDDGKLMLCAFSHFADFTPETIGPRLDDAGFAAKCGEAAGIAFTSWSVYPYMTDCWRLLCDEVLSGLTHRPQLLFDLADPASRRPAELVEVIDTLGGFERIGPVTLSLNGNEANQVADALGLKKAGDDEASLQRLAGDIRERAEISETSIHVIRRATSSTAEGAVTVEGAYCDKPARSVGAGDRFNAGLLAGLVLGLDPGDRLRLACASSGFFVRRARSAEWPELIEFIKSWGAGAPLGVAETTA